jgi:FkbM family methyltransferase
MGKAFERTRLAKMKIGHKTLLAHSYWMLSAFFPSPKRIRTYWGDVINLPRKSNYELLVLAESHHSPGSVGIFRQRVKPGMTVVDLGANIGCYTLLAASLVGERGRVYAFEPDPANYALLEKNVKANDYHNVVCRRQAVSNQTGKAAMYRGDYGVAHSLSASAEVNPEISETVDTVSLDDFFRTEAQENIDFIKMNIEGWEYFVIEGMAEVLRRSPRLTMMLEFHPDFIQKVGIEPAAFIRRLRDDRFNIRLIDEVKGLLPFNDTNLLRRHGSNILCERG